VVAAERALISLAKQVGGRATSPQAVDLALLEAAAHGAPLNPGQAAMVRELATSGARLQLALAPAGTGKTTAVRVLARAWTSDGGAVLGLAPSAATAAVLGAELAGPTDTLAKLSWSLDTLDQRQHGQGASAASGRGAVPDWLTRIGPGTLVVLDEAGMAGTPELARAARWIIDRGGSVRLVGDGAQLTAGRLPMVAQCRQQVAPDKGAGHRLDAGRPRQQRGQSLHGLVTGAPPSRSSKHSPRLRRVIGCAYRRGNHMAAESADKAWGARSKIYKGLPFDPLLGPNGPLREGATAGR